jgi:hypothetical protein
MFERYCRGCRGSGLGVSTDDRKMGLRSIGGGEEADFNGFGSGSIAMLGSEEHAIALRSEIQSGVDPSMEVTGSAQGLPGPSGSVLAHVMNDDDGEVVSTLALSQEREEVGDIAGQILVLAMKAHQRIEQEQSRPDLLYRVIEPPAIALEIESESRGGDDVDGKRGEIEVALTAESSETLPDEGGMILGEIDEHGARIMDLEATEAGCSRSDREREIEAEPSLPQFGVSGQEPDGGTSPERLDEPSFVRLGLVDVRDVADGQRLDRDEGHSGTARKTSSIASSRRSSSTKRWSRS